MFLDRLYRYLLRAMLILSYKKGNLVKYYSDILVNFMIRSDFQDALITFISSFDEFDENSLDPILVSVLLLKAKGEMLYECVWIECDRYLMSGSLEKRKERFRGLLKYVSCEEEKELLKGFLTDLYFSDLNYFQRLMTVSSKNLFKQD